MLISTDGVKTQERYCFIEGVKALVHPWIEIEVPSRYVVQLSVVDVETERFGLFRREDNWYCPLVLSQLKFILR